jgi:hypothetical protein
MGRGSAADQPLQTILGRSESDLDQPRRGSGDRSDHRNGGADRRLEPVQLDPDLDDLDIQVVENHLHVSSRVDLRSQLRAQASKLSIMWCHRLTTFAQPPHLHVSTVRSDAL